MLEIGELISEDIKERISEKLNEIEKSVIFSNLDVLSILDKITYFTTKDNVSNQNDLWKDIAKLSVDFYLDFDYYKQFTFQSKFSCKEYHDALKSLGFKEIDGFWKSCSKPSKTLVINYVVQSCIYRAIMMKMNEGDCVDANLDEVVITTNDTTELLDCCPFCDENLNGVHNCESCNATAEEIENLRNQSKQIENRHNQIDNDESVARVEENDVSYSEHVDNNRNENTLIINENSKLISNINFSEENKEKVNQENGGVCENVDIERRFTIATVDDQSNKLIRKRETNILTKNHKISENKVTTNNNNKINNNKDNNTKKVVMIDSDNNRNENTLAIYENSTSISNINFSEKNKQKINRENEGGGKYVAIYDEKSNNLTNMLIVKRKTINNLSGNFKFCEIDNRANFSLMVDDKIDTELKKDVTKLFKNYSTNIVNVNDIFDVNSKLNIKVTSNKIENIYPKLFKSKKEAQLILNLYNAYGIYEKFKVLNKSDLEISGKYKSYNESCSDESGVDEKSSFTNSCEEMGNNDIWHHIDEFEKSESCSKDSCHDKPNQEKVIDKLYRYVFYFLIAKHLEVLEIFKSIPGNECLEYVKCTCCEAINEFDVWQCTTCGNSLFSTYEIKIREYEISKNYQLKKRN